jgi:predicted RNase H-like HicB family nuclease
MNTESANIRREIVAAAGRRYVCDFRHQRRGGYLVTCPQFLPLAAYGKQLAEARAKARADIEAWIEYAECREIEPVPEQDRSLCFGSFDPLRMQSPRV